ncbi:hypothetical protein GCM10007897_43840 [Sphingobium jiangsuense]|uniref:Uncharacterized protein n=1 Tax=Sphingobium jiangsuense TaxID=870476 RepID=A0A7W6BMH3_9SPHN|nr:hypothetical protein [Sphingobium jiangsuense]MBB3927842.1 hypothetical protein [Sphingobium jiangsuense]GLT02953.1 hypothetical protein GCM10007897_43840 [Sphingobium jiangsuense]
MTTLTHWYTAASPGDRITYATARNVTLHPTQEVREARKLYDQGKVDLVQRRVTGGYEYIAVKRRVPAKVEYENSFAAALGRL